MKAAPVVLAVLACACTSVSVARLSPDGVHAGAGVRPLAAIQANAISAYLLFIPMPGVDLDRAVNQLLIATAKAMGADKVSEVRFDVTPESGVWALRKLIGWRSATASGIAVQVTEPPPDPRADDGPEPPR